MKNVAIMFKTFNFFEDFENFIKAKPETQKDEDSVVLMKRHVQKYCKSLEDQIFKKNLYKYDEDYQRKVQNCLRNMRALLAKDSSGEFLYK